MARQIPPEAPRSEDGYYWWDQDGNYGEGQWQPVHDPAAGTAEHGGQRGDAAGHGGQRGDAAGHAGQHGGAHHGGAQAGGTTQDAQQAQQHSIYLDLNQYSALWRLSQVYPNDEGIAQYLAQFEIDVSDIDWELHQNDRDTFYQAVLAAVNAIYQVVTEALSDSNAVTAATATAAAEAMSQVVTTGVPVCDFLYSDGHATGSDNFRQELEELRYEAGWLTEAVTSPQFADG